jgi:predicted DNA-binding protein (UPF0251 family)
MGALPYARLPYARREQPIPLVFTERDFDGLTLDGAENKLRTILALRALHAEGQNAHKAAARLGIHRNTLSNILAGSDFRLKPGRKTL